MRAFGTFSSAAEYALISGSPLSCRSRLRCEGCPSFFRPCLFSPLPCSTNRGEESSSRRLSRDRGSCRPHRQHAAHRRHTRCLPGVSCPRPSPSPAAPPGAGDFLSDPLVSHQLGGLSEPFNTEQVHASDTPGDVPERIQVWAVGSVWTRDRFDRRWRVQRFGRRGRPRPEVDLSNVFVSLGHLRWTCVSRARSSCSPGGACWWRCNAEDAVSLAALGTLVSCSASG